MPFTLGACFRPERDGGAPASISLSGWMFWAIFQARMRVVAQGRAEKEAGVDSRATEAVV